MKIRLICVTHKTPSWIETAWQEYQGRFPSAYAIEIIEIPAEKRSQHTNIERIKIRESEKILSAAHSHHHLVALDLSGKAYSSTQFASQYANWYQRGKPVDLFIGGADGLSTACLNTAQEKWSLSSLTFPHNLVRIIVAEQLFRAYSILHNHPYHR